MVAGSIGESKARTSKMGGGVLTALALASLVATGGALAQDAGGEIEEIIVTGSYIKQTPEDAALPVDVIDSEELFNQGTPSVVELVRRLGASAGNDGETNQFTGIEPGVATVNLRGLGPGRTLVLLNGRRNVFAPFPNSRYGRQGFVDINLFPSVAIERVEVLKDGAAATYGSDALAGVVNFITRSDFEGTEVRSAYKHIQDSDGDWDVSAIAGRAFGDTHIVVSAGYSERSELQTRDRDWATTPFGTNGNGLNYTGIPNPGSFFPLATTGPGAGFINPATMPPVRDPRCENFIGRIADASDPEGGPAPTHLAPRNNCTYSYLYFDNLIEKEERFQVLAELTHEISANHTFTAEFLYAETDIPEWKTSPSYPPQTLIDHNSGTGRLIPLDHPGLVAMGDIYDGTPDADNGMSSVDFAQYTAGTCDRTAAASGSDLPFSHDCNTLLFFGRPTGVAGDPPGGGSGVGSRRYDMLRVAVGFEGELTSNLSYQTSLLWSESNGERRLDDTYVERWSLAFQGLGGPNCDRSTEGGRIPTPGADGCLWYNPFSNSIQFPQAPRFDDQQITENPDFDPAVANTRELIKWMEEPLGDDPTTTLFVIDAVVSGETPWALPGADKMSFAVGVQWRQEEYETVQFPINDLNQNPCLTSAENARFRASGARYGAVLADGSPDPASFCDAGTPTNTADDYEGAGQFIFLAGSTNADLDQDILGVFGELQIPVTENIDGQFSVRFEDYGGSVGNTIDPKLALRWQAAEWLALRASASTTFRGPGLTQLSRRTTNLLFVPQAGTFKAIDTFGNSNLDPESAVTFNIGAIFEWDGLFTGSDNLYFSVDYWRFDITDPIFSEGHNQLIGAGFSDPFFDHDGDDDPDDLQQVLLGNLADDDTGDPVGNGPLDGRFQISGCDPTTANTCLASQIQRIRTNIINGPDIDTDGIDFVLRYAFDAGPGRMELWTEGTLINTYDVSSFPVGTGGAMVPARDALGESNGLFTYLRPLPEWKVKFGAGYELEHHNINLVANYIDAYNDRPSAIGPREIDSQVTIDLHYNLAFGDMLGIAALEGATFWASAYNLSDEAPPFAREDLNYDAFTHNAFGRIIKVGVRYAF